MTRRSRRSAAVMHAGCSRSRVLRASRASSSRRRRVRRSSARRSTTSARRSTGRPVQTPMLAAELIVALEMHWVTQAVEEGLGRTRALLALDDVLPPRLRAELLTIDGGLTIIAENDQAAGEPSYYAAIDLYRELGDARGEARLLSRLAVHAGTRGEREEARNLFDRARRADRGARRPRARSTTPRRAGDARRGPTATSSAHFRSTPTRPTSPPRAASRSGRPGRAPTSPRSRSAWSGSMSPRPRREPRWRKPGSTVTAESPAGASSCSRAQRWLAARACSRAVSGVPPRPRSRRRGCWMGDDDLPRAHGSASEAPTTPTSTEGVEIGRASSLENAVAVGLDSLTEARPRRFRPSRRAGGSRRRTASCPRRDRAHGPRGRPGSSRRAPASHRRRTGRAASGGSERPRARCRRTSAA